MAEAVPDWKGKEQRLRCLGTARFLGHTEVYHPQSSLTQSKEL